MKSDRFRKTRQGMASVELSAALILTLPLLVVMIFVFTNVVRACTMHGILQRAANQAARDLAISYGIDPDGTVSDPSPIFDAISYPGVVNEGSQFTIPAGGWKTGAIPPTVTVVVTFKGGTHGCPDFPTPDVFDVGSKIELKTMATQGLE